MSRLRFGELLSRQVDLSDHDVSEILEDQSSSRRRFGEIALAFRLCQPEHVWLAWWEQLADAPEHIDLDERGVDAQSLSQLPRAIADEFGVIPIRRMGHQVVLAVSEEGLQRAQQHLSEHLAGEFRFVLAPAAKIAEALRNSYESCEPQEAMELSA